MTTNLINRYSHLSSCANTGKSHDWQVARRRGNRIRMRCNGCALWDTKWMVERETKILGDVRIDSFGPHSHGMGAIEIVKEVPDTVTDAVGQVYADAVAARNEVLRTYTVARLREMAKSQKIRGYSKMNKDGLVNALGE